MLLTPDRVEFLNRCKTIVKKLGTFGEMCACGHDGTGYSYSDELIYIAETEDGDYLEIERKSSETPIVYINDNVVILFHGDFYFLHYHVDELYSKINCD